MDRNDRTPTHEATPQPSSARDLSDRQADGADPADQEANPPRTTTGKVTSPKFGSAGSGGLEYEGGLPRD